MAEFLEYEVSTKRWDMKAALFSHTPMSNEAARAMQRDLSDTDNEFKRLLRSINPSPPFDKDAPVESSWKVELEPGEQLGYNL